MIFTIDTTKHLTPVTRKTFDRHKQAFAQSIPYVLEAEFPELNILRLDKGKVVLQDVSGKRYSVVCSSNGKYDVAPSFTKGYGRCKDGVSIHTELGKTCQSVIFVDVKSVENISVRMLPLKDLTIPDNGVIAFE